MSSVPVSLIDVATYLPANRVPAEYYANFAGVDDLRSNLMFRAPEFRHHSDIAESNVDMVERAAAGRNWNEALEVPRERHRDTFHQCGNLFAAGIPVNFEAAINDGQVKAGDVVMMAAFAHAGDFAGAAAVRWGGRRT
jgi:3-oxoacyl-[acyl-carrier-protein] synthase III